MKKIKQVFPSRNYITVDSFGDVEVVFNPVGDGFEGDDKLMFRKGRWAFRVNDFLSGKVMADGSKEGMGRKVYSLNLVYDDVDGEPIVNTTYVDPTSVIPLDGSVVDVVGADKLAQEKTLRSVEENTKQIKGVLTDNIYNKIEAVENSVDVVGSAVEDVNSTIDNFFDDNTGYSTRAQVRELSEKLTTIENLCRASFISGEYDEFLADILSNLSDHYVSRFRRRNTNIESIAGNSRYSSGTVFYFGSTRFIALRTDCISIVVGNEILLLGDMSEYNGGTVKRLDGVKFAQSDVTKIVS